jgi:hypothetical protein
MAHARRKFEDAQDTDKLRATHVLSEMQKLYDIEQQAREKNLDHEARKALRDEKSTSTIKELKDWLIENAPVEGSKVLPQSKIGKAISYTLGMWHRIERYLDDGRYEIDNNWVENSIRPIALGYA